MTAVWLSTSVLTIASQSVTAGASIGRVSTSNYIISRGCNALALGAVVADFAIKYLWTGRADSLTEQIVFAHRADDLTGLLVFAVLTLRTLFILGIPSLDRTLFARRLTCAVAFAMCVACTIAAQNFGVYGFRMIALLPVIGIGLACLGEASDNTLVRRRGILAMGCMLAAFAYDTTAWGLMFKSLISDAGASAYNMVRYRDPPPWAPFSRGQPPRKEVSQTDSPSRALPIRSDDLLTGQLARRQRQEQ